MVISYKYIVKMSLFYKSFVKMSVWNGHFPINPLKKCPLAFIKQFTYNTVHSYGPQN